jgi:cyclopropane fatty-acyl-phospholipid synthase-like methyltransferase
VSRFGPNPRAFFEAVYRGQAPWDIGAPQPAMVALLAEYPPEGPVLDVGCGSGDLAIHVAERGIEALGIDFTREAIARAKSKKALLPPDVAQRVDFRVCDALHPSRLGRTFGAVVDSGFYHLFEPGQCGQFVEELASVLRPGGRCYLHEFAVTFDIPNVPRQVTEAELREQFSRDKGWQALTIRTGEFLSTVAPVPAIVACIEYMGRN